MTFDQFINDYLNKGLINEIKVNTKSIENLIRRASKEIKVAEANLIIDEGVAFTVAYTAMLHTARALMFFKGYRPADGYQHKTAVEFAGYVLGEKYKNLILHFDKMRKKRNIFTYEASISISETEVKNAISTASQFVTEVKKIIDKENPQLKLEF
ncbi:MAG: HEPN domain-containing protein [Candidatus Omnitrophota bacterium]